MALKAESPVTTALPMVPFSLAGMSFGKILEAKEIKRPQNYWNLVQGCLASCGPARKRDSAAGMGSSGVWRP